MDRYAATMGLLRNRLFRRLGPLGRIADIALVGGIGLRFAQRQGWISDEQVNRMGLAGALGDQSVGIGEIALAGAAALRLLRGRRKKA